MQRFDDMMQWLARVYVNALNIIHYMHDKYCYERIQMALHDKEVTRWFATGIAGLSVVADSLSAIKYAKVKTIRDENGIVVDYAVEGDFPEYATTTTGWTRSPTTSCTASCSTSSPTTPTVAASPPPPS